MTKFHLDLATQLLIKKTNVRLNVKKRNAAKLYQFTFNIRLHLI